MTLYQFNAMDEMEQIEAFWEGVHIGFRTEDGSKVECRQVDGFYVEVRYDETENHYTGVRSFKNPDHLAPYLDSVKPSGNESWSYYFSVIAAKLGGKKKP